MNTTIKLLAPIIALGLSFTVAASDKPVSAKDRAAITELLRKHDATLSAGNLDDFYSLMTDDYVELPGGAPPEIGKDAARKSLAEFLAKNQYTPKNEIKDLAVAGDWAYVRTQNDQRLAPKTGEPPMAAVGKALIILKRQGDGGWKIKTLMWNNDGPFKPIGTTN